MLLGTIFVTANADGNEEVCRIGESYILSSNDPYDGGSNGWALISHGVGEGLCMLDEEGSLYSTLIDDLEQTDDHNWTVKLNQDKYFSDGTQVNADAFCWCISDIMENSVSAQMSAPGLMTATPVDEFTVNVETENVTAVLPCNFCEFQNVLYKITDDGEYSFTGPYMVKESDPGNSVYLVPNPYYPDAEQRPDVEVLAFVDESQKKLALETGELDVAYTFTKEVADLLEAEGIRTVQYDAGYQYFVHVNLEDEATSELAVRQAINKGLNREEMVAVLGGGRVANGIFATYYSFAGDNATEYDPEGAAQILEEAGWVLNEDGIRERDGKTLDLHIITYAQRPDMPIITQLASAQLEELGFNVNAEIVADITQAENDGDYSIAFTSRHTANTGDPTNYLKMFTTGGSVAEQTRYSSADFDKEVEYLGTLPLGEEKDAQSRLCQDILYQDLPVIYLIDPQWYIGVSERMENYVPYSGDYYVINSTFGLN